MRRFALVLLLAATPSLARAQAETLITSVSTPRVAIQTNFAGADIVVFGGIGREAGPRRRGRYDIVVTVRGPVAPTDVRRKDRILGVWITAEREAFRQAPSFLAIASTRPVADIVGPDMVRQFGLSLDAALIQDADSAPDEDGAFRAALIRLRSQAGLYLERPSGVTFLSDSLFRATIALPANVPLGIYQVETRLLADGEVLTGQRASLEVIKTGFDDRVARFATESSALYGLVNCAIALALGWLATIVFRRD